MKRIRKSGSTFLASAVVLAALTTLTASGGAFAQLQAATSSHVVMASPSSSVLSGTVLKAHQDDLEAMITDLSKVQTPEAAAAYHGYLGGQMDKYMTNHKRLHHVAIPGFASAKKAGQAAAEHQKLADATERLGETHYPRLVSEMDRVEKLNPNLKKNFDVLRNLD